MKRLFASLIFGGALLLGSASAHAGTTIEACGVHPTVESAEDGTLRWFLRAAKLRTDGWNVACYNKGGDNWHFIKLDCDTNTQRPHFYFSNNDYDEPDVEGRYAFRYLFKSWRPVKIEVECEDLEQ